MQIINEKIKLVDHNGFIFFISDIASIEKTDETYWYYLSINFRSGKEKSFEFEDVRDRDREYDFIYNELVNIDVEQLAEINRIIGNLGGRQISI